ncbi:diaminopimelate epimerase [Paenibacillus psychroresistens]|uniref:Diaminopimelate epimerase n=2 Tax=Paenibacillus psychroresistens TaxID=1778678 RepID=A0A6B8RZA1_9BACL|nr:diaminopimelate epimerase [Paenibacillus psychroresistens]
MDPNHTQIELTTENIKLICHRHYGAGSDGILYGPIISGDEIKLRIFNPDGSEAEKSGNGIRIFSRYLLDAGYITSDSFVLQTLGGQVVVEILKTSGELIKVNMGKVSFQSDVIPMLGDSREVIDEEMKFGDEGYNVTCLSIGNPHCVIPATDISEALARKLGPLVENHSDFPNKINLQLLKVMDRHNIQIEIWERGAGYTMASGSSSCAAASAAFRLGLIENKVAVHMPGGIINIEITADGFVYMTGTVDSVARGVFTDHFLKQLQ